MKKTKIFFCLALAFTSITSCQKETFNNDISKESSAAKDNIEVCHYDESSGTYHPIIISFNAWPAHQAHGDVMGDCSTYVNNCDQEWALKNLDVTTYRNGDVIPQVSDPVAWRNLTTGAWCYYNNDPTTNDTYGKLYNIFAVTDPRGLAPEGWHISTRAEWAILGACFGGDNTAGGALKSTGTIQDGTGTWEAPNTGATNSSGFTGQPGGLRDIFGTFIALGQGGYWWSATQDPSFTDYYYGRWLTYDSDDFLEPTAYKTLGLSVRVVKD